MRREKGSALLTVILIAAVTATIGAAISSFILVNYRLRAYDNQIRRAEYKAEEVIDTTHLYLLSEFGATDGIFFKLKTEVDNDISEEYNDLTEGLESEADYHYYNGSDWAVLEDKRQELLLSFFEDLITGVSLSRVSFSMDSIIRNIIDIEDNNAETECVTAIPPNAQEGKSYVILDTARFDSNRIIQKVNICYVIPKNAVIRGNPIAKFSVEYVIACPDYSKINASTYNITDYIGITNWTIENDWRL